MSYCGICGDDDHAMNDCELYLRNRQPPPDDTGLLPQHRRCWTCKQITHAWDHMPCGQHSTPGADLPRADAPPPTPHRDRTHDLQAFALAQLAEARAERGDDIDQWWAAQMRREREQLRLPAPQDDNQGPGQDQPARHASEQQGR
jgi:hypothetical protein